jgi:hypothetical protein
MASYISDTEKTALVAVFNRIFETFEQNIIVYKESIKNPINNTDSNNFVFGFGDGQGENAYSYTQVTGVYPALIRYPQKNQNIALEQYSNSFISDGDVSIKVERDCRDFINSGKTEKFVIHDRTFILDSEEQKQTFLGTEFYVYKLKAAK